MHISSYNGISNSVLKKRTKERTNPIKIILDTDKKTITVPWNYTVKLEEINRMVKEFGGPEAKIKTFSGYIDECWKEAMAHSDTQLKTAPRPSKPTK